MFDIGWSEMLVVGVVALIVVGPKDLPKMFHTIGELTGKARGMAREFQRAMDAAAKETGVSGAMKDFKRAASGQGLRDTVKEAAGFDDIEKDFRDIGHDKPAVRSPGTKANPVMPPKSAEVSPVAIEDEFDEAEADEIAAQDLARRNAELSETEAQRLKKQKQAEAARQKAAAIRAAKEAEAAEAEAERWRPDPRADEGRPAASTKPHPDPEG
ncbi:Sec-independent protein translocase protein TatB [Pararhodobacter aggregans]|uniref:Sec-independent protein translocase protein TatB n=1 Tax=Pararhodobacter aggregans TaxID=404875 RepID=UPI003A8F63D2